MTKRDIKRIRQAIYLAIDGEEAHMDAQRTSYRRRVGPNEPRPVPRENRSAYETARRNIAAFKKLLALPELKP